MGENQMGQLEVVSIRLVRDAPILSEHKICTPKDAVIAAGELMCDLDKEVVCVINLKTDGTPINCHFASMGAVNHSIASPRELFKTSILSNAATMILVHNHPSGHLFPSKEDTMLTDKLLKLCDMMEIPLLDHVIVGGDNGEYFSFREKGIIKNPYYSYSKDYKELRFNSSVIAGKSR